MDKSIQKLIKTKIKKIKNIGAKHEDKNFLSDRNKKNIKSLK